DVNLTVFIDGEFIGSSDTISMSPNSIDTLYVSDFVPEFDLGFYEIEYVFDSDALESDYADNGTNQAYKMNYDDYSRDKGQIDDFFSMALNNESILGSVYQFEGESYITALEVAVSNTSQGNIDFYMELRDPHTFELLEVTEKTTLLDPALYGNEVGNEWQDVYWIRANFEDNINVEEGDSYLVTFKHLGTGQLDIALSEPAPINSVFYAVEDDNAFSWLPFDRIPFIRVTKEVPWSVFEDETQEPKLSFFPNPAGNETNINFELDVAHEVRMELRNSSGRLILFKDLGQYSQGIHTHQLDTSQIPQGTYQITLLINGQPFTQSLIVQR
ncbi:MAG: T9SS type A sorting domain-containing protein, partial [Bacteroidota bacterium]